MDDRSETEYIDTAPDPLLLPLRRLAAAVIRRAFQDLRGLSGPHSASIRRDAFEFLSFRLWQSNSLWYDLVGSSLMKRQLIETARQRYRQGKKK